VSASAVKPGIVPQELIDRLVEAYRPERIYLFGSYARGEAGADSDIDLMIVVPDDAEGPRRRGGLGYRALHGLRFLKPCEFHVWRRQVFNDEAPWRNSLPGEVLRDGELLYRAHS
jgi:predicted nucleotidyltransferase